MNIFVFGDQTADQQSLLRKIFSCKDHVLLSSFLQRASVALRDEIARLPRIKREGIPDFMTLQELIERHYEYGAANPALESATLCISQLAHFIAYFEDRPSETFVSSQTHVVGICTGSIAAAAVACANSLLELIPLAVEGVRVAFRTGVHVSTTAQALEQTVQANGTWSEVVTGVGEDEIRSALDGFHKEETLTGSNHAYISAVTLTSTTISGPPSTLNRLFQDSECLRKGHRISLPIHGPYHAPQLYPETDLKGILSEDGSLKLLTNEAPMVSYLHSALTGEALIALSRFELLTSVIDEILRQPVRWDRIVKELASEKLACHFFQRRVITFGVTSLGNSIVSTLKTEGIFAVTLEDHLSWITERNEDAGSTRSTGKSASSKIAIIGMSGRFPGAKDHELLWELLEKGLDVHREIPPDRFDAQAHTDPTGKDRNKSHTPFGCFIEEPGLFDPRFFSMSPREAAQTDPMQRLALVTAYEALEMSGYSPNRTPSTKAHRVGTFYGQTSDDWREINAAQNIDTYFITGGVRAFAPGRINYFFKFSGPSFSIDTACSSSLAAIQLACTSLWAGDCDTAITGGLNILTNPDIFSGLSKGQFLSKTGSCKTYDHEADGYCRGDGIASIVMKRLEDAIADNDNILGCIISAGTNHSAEAISITHPHAGAQEFLYKKVLQEANVDPHEVSYIEMHGTGTQAGDGIEMRSVTNVFAPRHRRRRPNQPLYIGAIKANIGHGEAASGSNSLIKIMLMLRYNSIPPHVGIKKSINRGFPKDLTERNVHIPFHNTPFYRPAPGQKRRVFLNNFSAAGGNTALLIEDAPTRTPPTTRDPRSTHVIAVSAKSLASLKKNIIRLLGYLGNTPSTSLSNLAYTTTARRIQHNYRVSVAASDIPQLKDLLAATLNGPLSPIPAVAAKVAFVFTGQGSHYAALGKALFEGSLQFRVDIQHLQYLSEIQGFPSFIPLIDGSVTDLQSLSPVVTQLGQTCTQIALARLWASWGVKPSVVLGHSLGEYAALNIAGVLSASDTIFLVGHRAKLLETDGIPGTHCMLAVRASASAIEKVLGSAVLFEIACFNGPEDTVICGSIADMASASDMLASRGFKLIKLNVPFAFHSSQIDPIQQKFEIIAKSVTFNTPKIPIISPLLREVVREGNVIGTNYLARHARETVDFIGGLAAAERDLMIDHTVVWVEIGPHPVCSNFIKSCLGNTVMTTPTLQRNEDPWMTLAKSLSTLYGSGLIIDWNEYHREFEQSLRLLLLPSYSFDEKNYWLEYTNNWCLTKGDTWHEQQGPVNKVPRLSTTSVQRIVEQEFKDGKGSMVIESNLSETKLHAAVSGHLVNGAALCPSSIYADIALTIADYMYRQLNPSSKTAACINVRNMEVFKPLIAKSLPRGQQQLLQVSATVDLAQRRGELLYSSTSPDGKTRIEHAKCVVDYGDAATWLAEWERTAFMVQSRVDLLMEKMQRGDAHKILRGMAYKLFAALVEYDQKFRGMEEVVLDSSALEATSKVSFQTTPQDGDFFCSPYWIDSVAHISGFIMNASDGVDSRNQVYVSHGWESMRFAKPLDAEKTYRSYVRMTPGAGKMAVGDVYVFDGSEIVGLVGGLKFQCIPRTLLNTLLPPIRPTKSQPPAGQAHGRPQPVSAKVTTTLTHTNTASLTSSTTKRITVSTKQFQSSSLVDRALSIIATEVDVDISELDNQRLFSDLGVDSLMSLTISAKFREDLDLEISSTLFADYPTVGDMKRFLIENDDSGSSSESLLESYDMVNAPSTPDIDEGMQTPSTPPSSLSGASGLDSSNTQSDDASNLIRAIIATEMGVDIQELASSTSLAAMGMDSLMSLAILGALREKMGVTLASTFLAENVTLADIEKALIPQPTAKISQLPQALKKPSTHSQMQPLPQATSVLLQGHLKTATKTLFLLPDGSGSATSYIHIPPVSPSTAVYALNCPFMKTPEDYTIGIPAVSTIYLNEIRRRQPRGPYYVGGWSAGGVVAYECSRQLLAAGEAVDTLLLLDAPCPVALEPLPSRLHQFFDRIGLLGDGTPGRTPGWLLPHFDASIKALDSYDPPPMVPTCCPRKTVTIWARDGVCKPGDPRPPPGETDDPKSMKWLLDNRTDFEGNGWETLVGGKDKMQCFSMGGHHFSMMKGALAAELCQLMREGLGDN